MWRKACPKCSGTVYKETHLANEYDLVCLQCGRILNRAEERALRALLLERQGIATLGVTQPIAPLTAAPQVPQRVAA